MSNCQKQINKAINSKDSDKQKLFESKFKNLQFYFQQFSNSPKNMMKTKMQDLFWRRKVLKSGKQGKVLQFPTVLTLHTTPNYIKNWVQYSLKDTETTFYLRQFLQEKLRGQNSEGFKFYKNLWQIYQQQWLPFGQCLTSMERKGFKINRSHVQNIKNKAKEDLIVCEKQFIKCICQLQNDPNIHLFNPASAQQMQQLLHAPFKVSTQIQKKNQYKDENQLYDYQSSQILQNALQQQTIGPKKAVRTQITQLPAEQIFMIDNPDPKPQIGKAKLPMKIKGLGIQPVSLTPKGLPSVDVQSLKQLAGKPKQKKYGKIFEHFQKIGEQKLGIKLSQAVQKLIQYRNIQTLYNTFIEPLYGFIDQNDRIHCSLNINTQTGRLSARKPNLQNQPALQKDIYKIRQAFVAQKGKKLIVADYGQLQLRVLAHISDCKKMIQAFKEGGDFHSRTAIGMYDYIQKDLSTGKVLLQWDKSKGQAPAPLIKDKYASQRRKAKTVNFSIAYGKTAEGFAKDWGVTRKQAQKVINAWFKQRVQVKEWQDLQKDVAKKLKLTRTLIGRVRNLNKFEKDNIGMMNRRAVNTPIQGGAADIVIAAMVKIHKNEKLKKLGWQMQLQIHDQLILEGPEQSAKQALQIVKESMSHPFEHQLRLQLEIDAKIGDSWYECK